MDILRPNRENLLQSLKDASVNSVELIVIIAGALEPFSIDGVKTYLTEAARALKPGGLLFVQGRPEFLSDLGTFLDQHLTFKYWIAIESNLQPERHGLPSAHAAILLFTKGNNGFKVKQTRFPHQNCAFCGRSLKDWGGKKHLMNPEGFVISDVWTSLPRADNYSQLSGPALGTILRMLDDGSDRHCRGIIGPKEGIADELKIAETRAQYRLPLFVEKEENCQEDSVEADNELFNVVLRGDALKVLQRYPDSSVDLVFADPPYNLQKAYTQYEDARDDYVAWCNSWLAEYARVLKPSGSLFVLNLPRWSIYHASFLNQKLYFQNWIVWDALSEPRGKIMPAHYGLLYYTKHPTNFTFNYSQVGKIDARYYCLRASCIRDRKAMGADDKQLLTDFWRDIHRIKHRRDRDYHPCQLPEAIMERIVRLSTNPGDVVLDAFSGTGTTAVVAARLGRRYVAIDLDENYVRITKKKIAEVRRHGYVARQSISKPRQQHTKKELQLELRAIAAQLGRLPTPEDVREMSKYDLRVFYTTFPTWGKALKAAKLEVSA